MLYLLRHGQTEWNRETIFRGRKDIPLSGEGREQAKLTAEVFKKADIKKIFSSPLIRAMDTAEIVGSALDKKPEIVEGLIDLDFGNWEGKPLEWVKEKYQEEYYMYKNHPENAVIPGGENLLDCFNRVGETISGIIKSIQEQEASIILVSHRVILKMAVLWLLGLGVSKFWKIQLDTCSITRFTIRDNMNIICGLNDTCHLQQFIYGGKDF